jgi:hypothetical protein
VYILPEIIVVKIPQTLGGHTSRSTCQVWPISGMDCHPCLFVTQKCTSTFWEVPQKLHNFLFKLTNKNCSLKYQGRKTDKLSTTLFTTVKCFTCFYPHAKSEKHCYISSFYHLIFYVLLHICWKQMLVYEIYANDQFWNKFQYYNNKNVSHHSKNIQIFRWSHSWNAFMLFVSWNLCM